MAATLTIEPDEPRGKLEPEPYLHFVLQCDKPHAPSLRVCLGGFEQVEIGRAAELSFATRERGSILVLGLPDQRMSSRHLSVARIRRDWIAEDLESKNGTLVDGEACRRAALGEGSMMQLGHTSVLFRVGSPSDGPALVSAEQLSAPPALRTFDTDLEHAFTGLLRVAPSQLSVLVLGETGTGKERVARAIHEHSCRTGAFVAVNCGAIPENLVESELFGFKKGTFSGALQDQVGFVAAADGGTLFLDEVGDLPPSAQTALLRVLQEREVVPLGERQPTKVDVRVVAATNRSLDEQVSQGKFRADLYARLAGHRVELPPLRERKCDLGLLVSSLLRLHAPPDRDVSFTLGAASALVRHDWPLNIRELEQALAAALLLSAGAPIAVEHLPASVREALKAGRADARARVLSAEEATHRQVLVSLLEQHQGNVASVARSLGKAPAQVYRWIKRYEISVATIRESG